MSPGDRERRDIDINRNPILDNIVKKMKKKNVSKKKKKSYNNYRSKQELRRQNKSVKKIRNGKPLFEHDIRLKKECLIIH